MLELGAKGHLNICVNAIFDKLELVPHYDQNDREWVWSRDLTNFTLFGVIFSNNEEIFSEAVLLLQSADETWHISLSKVESIFYNFITKLGNLSWQS